MTCSPAVATAVAGHHGWTYRSREEYRRGRSIMVDRELAVGRSVLVVEACPDEARSELLPDAGVGGARADAGMVRVAGHAEVLVLGGEGVLDPQASLDLLLRVAGADVHLFLDPSPLLGTRAERAAAGAFEHLLGTATDGGRTTAECAFDSATLGESAVDELMCLHPPGPGRASLRPAFRLYVLDGTRFLSGEVDIASVDLFALAVACQPEPTGPVVRIDADACTFLDPRALAVLERWAARHGVRVHLRSHDPVLARVVAAVGRARLTVMAGPPQAR